MTSREPSLNDAARDYLAGMAGEESGPARTEIYKFIRWFGRERTVAGLTPAEIGNYAEHLSVSDTEYSRKLELVRGFLQHAKKKGWCQTSLATHLKARKGKTARSSSGGQSQVETVSLTQEGYDRLVQELESLKNARHEIIGEIRRAAADKDFRENAPLHAAREQRGKIEGRIMEVEATLKASVIIDKGRSSGSKVSLGDIIVLCDLDSGEELSYTLVSSSEVDPVKGRISGASPIGKAVMAKEEGDTVEISAPAGKMRYQIKQVSH